MRMIHDMKMRDVKRVMSLLLVAITAMGPLVAQYEVERDLWVLPVEKQDEGMESAASNAARGGALNLPFFDDFSTPSLVNAPGNIPADLIRWTDASARITESFAIMPPTIGVATLDGLDATGYPYSFNNVDLPGWCDTLTSRPIVLSGYTPESNIFLSFQLQTGGRGNAADVGSDSLIVEFLAPSTGQEENWTQVWSTDSTGEEIFELVFIPVLDQTYLQNGFQFRFRNYGSLSGLADLWHIDYVYLDDGIDPEAFNYFEVAFVEPEYTLLRDFSRMPWPHFQSNPQSFMRDSTITLQRNLSGTQTDNVTSGFKVEFEGVISDFENSFSNTSVLPFEVFETGYYISDGVEQDFAFDPTVSDTCATFDVSFYEDPIGIYYLDKVGVVNNDSMVFQQVFTNDYAYDDNSAEKAYSITAAGAKLAVRFPVAEPDTLLGLAIHFIPYYDNASDETFLLRAWTDDGGIPGEELGENYLFHNPQYFTDGYDVFSYYEYDDPIPVDGTVHVGFVQSENVMLNVGLDKNSNANIANLHYQLGLGGEWLSSGIEGTVMVRPVFRAAKTEAWSGLVDIPVRPEWSLAPNPARDHFNVSGLAPGDYAVFNAAGQLHWSTTLIEKELHIDTRSWTPGTYYLCALSGDQRGRAHQVLILP
jgi:hypothetical protein